MKVYNAEKIKNIVIAGHGSRGKTSLAEAMLFFAGATDRLGKITEGNTVLDCDAEEKSRKISVSTAVAPFEYNDCKINLIDTPGLFDFAGGVSEGLRAGDCALIVTAAGCGYDVGAEKIFKATEKLKMSKMVAITKVDAENTNFYKTISMLREVHGNKICPVVVPYMDADKVSAYVDLITKKAYKYADGKPTEVDMPGDEFVDQMNSILCEAVASQDDEMMEKFFDGVDFSAEEVIKGLATGVADGSLVPVFACSGFTMGGIDLLVEALSKIAPSAKEASAETGVDESGNEVEIACDENAPLAAICFKTIADPFVGKMSFIKVVSGKLSADSQAFNMRTGENERIGKIVTIKGSKQEDAAAIVAGDIGVVTKLANVITGDTLCAANKKVTLAKVDFPAPCLQMALKVRKKGEEEKLVAGITRLMEEDPTISYKNNTETKEQVVSGLGEQHLAVIVSKLKTKFGVEVDLTVPKVAYRETIKKKIEVQGRHKKQSGGHGQFGDVFIRFEPCDSEELVFAEEVFGGSVPKNFFPAVEKGLRECTAKGVLAGYPMVGVKATLYDGSYHPVDSSEMAFKMAAAVAFKNGIPDANPVLLEPIGTLKAYMPDEKMGDIMGDITKRRGRMLGMGPAEDGLQELVAEVPMAELGDFATVLRSVTAGKGYFTLEFARYEEAPQNVALKVIEARKAELAE
ncbi:MAG: elongation factor G [Clostridiales bacterium]|nr:elongation factor G [Clostridiales bacterium]